MRRRDFLSLVGSGLTFPRPVLGQQALPMIGYLGSSNEAAAAAQLTGYRTGLASAGYVEGRTVLVEWRWASGDADKVLPFLNDLIGRRVSVLSLHGILGVYANAGGPFAGALAASGIPAVSGFPRDPAKYGFVNSLSRPGGNLTGVNQQTQELEPKRLNLLHELVPSLRTVGYLSRPTTAVTPSLIQDAQKAAQALGLRLVVLSADTVAGIDAVFATLGANPIDALIVGADPFFNTNRQQVVRLVNAARMPAVAEWSSFAEEGALLSYGTSLEVTQKQIAGYIGAILNGVKPGDLPIVQNTSFDLAINLRTARSMGIAVSQSMFAQATQVIE